MVTHSWEAWLTRIWGHIDILLCPERIPIQISKVFFFQEISGFYLNTTFHAALALKAASPHHILDLRIIHICNIRMILKKNHATTVLCFPWSFTKTSSNFTAEDGDTRIWCISSSEPFSCQFLVRWFNKFQDVKLRRLSLGSKKMGGNHVIFNNLPFLSPTFFSFWRVFVTHGKMINVEQMRPYGVLWNPMAWWKSHPTAVPKDPAKWLEDKHYKWGYYCCCCWDIYAKSNVNMWNSHFPQQIARLGLTKSCNILFAKKSGVFFKYWWWAFPAKVKHIEGRRAWYLSVLLVLLVATFRDPCCIPALLAHRSSAACLRIGSSCCWKTSGQVSMKT